MNGNNGRPKKPHVIGMRHDNAPADPVTIAMAAMIALIICLSCGSLAAAIASVVAGAAH
ncbi:MAG TPA: hypothetical protein VMX14_13410 [Anaerolineae bacterium]|nr:hypothetical protein [Anaerolineae bacterium]